MAIFKHVHKSARFENRAGCTSRADVRRLLDYLMRPSAHGTTVWNDFQNTTPDGLTEELMALARPDLTYRAYHFMLSFPAAERAIWEANLDGVLTEFAQRFQVDRMVWASHEDKENFHVHGCIFAQNARGKKLRLETKVDGKTLAVAPSLRRLAQDWEDRLGTQKTGRGRTVGTAICKDGLLMAQRQYAAGQIPSPVPAKMQLRANVERIVTLSTSFADLQSHAAAAGIEIRYTQYANGTGVSFSNGDVSLRGREAGYTFSTLTQLFHEPNPRIERRQPIECMAEGNRRRDRSSAPSRIGKTDRTPHAVSGNAADHRRGELGTYRGLEETIRAVSGIGHQDGLLALLQFLTSTLGTMIHAADAQRPMRRTQRPTL